MTFDLWQTKEKCAELAFVVKKVYSEAKQGGKPASGLCIKGDINMAE